MTLWIISLVLLGATAALYVINPSRTSQSQRDQVSEELSSTIGKAETYYDFGHYERAAETYADAAEEGMADGESWYRYAESLDKSGRRDLGTYMTAYELLIAQSPNHEYLATLESLIAEEATSFEYSDAVSGELAAGSLIVVQGTVSRVEWGRVASGTDTVFVATRPDNWLGHTGDVIIAEISRDRRFAAGQTVVIVGWYDGWCEHTEFSEVSRDYPCIRVSGVRPVTR